MTKDSKTRKADEKDLSPRGLVSVLMAAYNGARYISQAIEAVLNQTYGNLELVIVDDGSQDRTREIVSCFENDKIRYFYKGHSGMVGTWNLAMEKARGDFVIFIDADDIPFPTLLEREMEVFIKYPGVEVVYPNLLLIDEESNETGEIWRYKDYSYKEMISTLFKPIFTS